MQQSGLDPRAYHPSPLGRRVAACLRKLRVGTIDEAQALLQARPDLLRGALNVALIGVSEFFRDPAVFGFLGHTALPALLASKPGLRVFSAGSSDGQELYSVAMLLAELGALNDSRLLGIDCRPDAVGRSRSGQYEAAQLARVPPGLRERHCSIAGTRAIMSPALRESVDWRVDDLLTFREGAWDLILFRNVAIYLNASHAAAVWENLCEQLSPGGYLVTGQAEAPPRFLPLVRVCGSVYRKMGFPRNEMRQ